MSNYKESKKKLDAIRQKFCCKGDIIFRTAIQNVVEFGQVTILDPGWYQCTLDDVHAKHDNADKEGRWLFVTRDFELAILECMKELAEINSYDLLIYIQKEVWLGGGDVGEPDYKRALEIITNCMSYMEDCYGAYSSDMGETLDKFQCVMSDEEIAYFGWEHLFDIEEDEED